MTKKEKIAEFVKDAISQQIHLFRSGNVVVESFFDAAPENLKEEDHCGVYVYHYGSVDEKFDGDEKVVITVDLGNLSFDILIKIPE